MEITQDEKLEKAKELLESLGLGGLIKIKEKPKKLIPDRIVRLEEYNLITSTECTICGSVDDKYFIMKWSDEDVLLHAVSIQESEMFDTKLETKTKFFKVPKCPHCVDVLRSKEKDELTDIIIKLQNKFI